MEAYAESMMEEDVKPSFGLAMDEGQHRDHKLGFQHSSLRRRTNRIYNIISSPLRIGLRETKLPSQISCVVLDSRTRRSELHRVQHPHVGVAPCVGVHAFDPSLGIGCQKILNWYPVE